MKLIDRKGLDHKDDACALYYPNTLDDNIYDPVDTGLVAKMHKAITVIQLKLEGQLMEKHPEWEMQHSQAYSFSAVFSYRKYALLTMLSSLSRSFLPL